jgi:(p)ppGpp synthase/HD superfamily hydrolase
VSRLLTSRFSTALVLAAELHAAQRRKDEDRVVPYVSHLLAVTALVLEDGGDEDQAIAALLHDSVEDQGMTEARLTEEFGAEVARIVMACSDAAGEPGRPKPPWEERKRHHLAALARLGPDEPVLRVTAADKLHNCRGLLADVRGGGLQRLARFNGGVEGTCWYYGEMAALLRAGLPASALTAELTAAAESLADQLRRGSSDRPGSTPAPPSGGSPPPGPAAPRTTAG